MSALGGQVSRKYRLPVKHRRQAAPAVSWAQIAREVEVAVDRFWEKRGGLPSGGVFRFGKGVGA